MNKQSAITIAVFLAAVACFWVGAEIRSLPLLVIALVALTGWALYHPKQKASV